MHVVDENICCFTMEIAICGIPQVFVVVVVVVVELLVSMLSVLQIGFI